MKKNNLKHVLFPWIKNTPEKIFSNFSLDSRKITSQDVFLAIEGSKENGNNFISEAIEKKVVAILSETKEKEKHGEINYINTIPILSFFQLSENISHLAGRMYKEPAKKLTIIGVTGTNGKTTVTQLINQWSELLGKKTGTMGTLGNGFFNNLKPTKNTTSSAIDIQSFLYIALKKKLI
ncbi:Mur ligase family protein [Buchnera aphidicola]|uniref:Mur ligase family protein n=1 Tax=Buchnera aphidicola TaxID=9 RepID=UPI0021C36C7D|nr:Mur ligase family protein [Buchnera aphidicola]